MFSRVTTKQPASDKRGDSVNAVKTTGRRAFLSAGERGFSLIELVITITIMTILTMGVIPLVKVSVKRQKEHGAQQHLTEKRKPCNAEGIERRSRNQMFNRGWHG